jgi:phosphotransferase system enzyme I (PtsI)
MEKETKSEQEIILKGIAVSPGIAIGAALIIGKKFSKVTERSIKPEEVDEQIRVFRDALDKTREQIRHLQQNLNDSLKEKHSTIFDAHLLITQDKMLIDEVEAAVRKELKNIDFLFYRTIKKYVAAISSMSDDYIRERVGDVKDVASRIIINMHGTTENSFDNLPGQRIIVAHDLTPSDTASLDRENVLSFATEVGSRTSHTAIMARSMEIPAVVGIALDDIPLDNGDLIIVDGYKGILILNPKPSTLEIYARRETREEEIHDEILKESSLRPETVDRFRIQLAANIEIPNDIEAARKYGAAGIGLFRTEYLYLNRTKPPGVIEQYEIYKDLLERLDGYPLIVRTFDIGGDKLSSLTETSSHIDPNPFLGCRAIRLHLDHPELLQTQIRAILMASAFGDVKIMFPMITCMDEVGQLKGLVEMEKREMESESIPFNKDIEIGVMIETPSAAIIADQLAKKVDFFSIGTNDLVQYTLAVDRSNEKVAYLYQPSHPAILALIKRVTDAAYDNGIWVSVCGEMAGDPRYIPLLVGIGIHELSMSASSIGPVRRLIRRLYMHDCEKLLAEAMKSSTADDVLDLTESLLYEIAPDIMNMTYLGE